LGTEVRALLVQHPPPLAGGGLADVPVLRDVEAHRRISRRERVKAQS
jgi:hypothetical protein